MNDFPEPGLNDVMRITLRFSSEFDIKSILERSTRNASLSMSRLPSAMIKSVFLSLVVFFFLRKTSDALSSTVLGLLYIGISPTRGTEILSRSFLPRTLVFMFSLTMMIPAGIARPRANAISMILAFCGDVGLALPRGAVMTRVLYAVNACESSFSSRFCRRKRYRASFTFC